MQDAVCCAVVSQRLNDKAQLTWARKPLTEFDTLNLPIRYSFHSLTSFLPLNETESD